MNPVDIHIQLMYDNYPADIYKLNRVWYWQTQEAELINLICSVLRLCRKAHRPSSTLKLLATCVCRYRNEGYCSKFCIHGNVLESCTRILSSSHWMPPVPSGEDTRASHGFSQGTAKRRETEEHVHGHSTLPAGCYAGELPNWLSVQIAII